MSFGQAFVLLQFDIFLNKNVIEVLNGFNGFYRYSPIFSIFDFEYAKAPQLEIQSLNLFDEVDGCLKLEKVASKENLNISLRNWKIVLLSLGV